MIQDGQSGVGLGEPPAAPHAADAPPPHCSPQDVQWRLVGLWPLHTQPTSAARKNGPRDAAAQKETQGGPVGLPPLQKQLARPAPTSQDTPDPASLNLDFNASGLAAKKTQPREATPEIPKGWWASGRAKHNRANQRRATTASKGKQWGPAFPDCSKHIWFTPNGKLDPSAPGSAYLQLDFNA